MTASNANRIPTYLCQVNQSPTRDEQSRIQAFSPNTAPTKQATTVELCPPHWRLRHKTRLRSRVKAALLKSSASTTTGSLITVPRSPTSCRPAMVRMKDSDDYITARAANPRTGIISPSIGSSSPATPRMPETPAEALKIPSRPPLSRANEGRKFSGGDRGIWRTGYSDANGWLSGSVPTVASPRETITTANASLTRLNPSRILHEDAFIIHMPSGREPQPYEYPGCTAEQIQAFEHYKRKVRLRVENTVQDSGRQLGAATFAPYNSPRIPACLENDKRKGNVHELECSSLKGPTASMATLRRKPVGSEPKLIALPRVDYENGLEHGMSVAKEQWSGGISSFTNLGQLPRVHLIRPELASIPHRQPHGNESDMIKSQPNIGSRSDDPEPCSRSDQTGGTILLHPDGLPNRITVTEHNSFFSGEIITMVTVLEAFFDLTGYIFAAFKHAPVPQIALVKALYSSKTTPQQKVDALKTILKIAGQTIGTLTVVTIAWKLGVATMLVVNTALWPFALPFRILCWLAGLR